MKIFVATNLIGAEKERLLIAIGKQHSVVHYFSGPVDRELLEIQDSEKADCDYLVYCLRSPGTYKEMVYCGDILLEAYRSPDKVIFCFVDDDSYKNDETQEFMRYVTQVVSDRGVLWAPDIASIGEIVEGKITSVRKTYEARC